MKKRFFDCKGKSIVAILTSLALVAAMAVSLPGVKAWAANYGGMYDYNTIDAVGGVRIYPTDGSAGDAGLASGSMSAGQTFFLMNGTGINIDNFSTKVVYENGTLYTLTRNVNYSIEGNNITFTPGAGGAAGEGASNAQDTPELLAYARFHDHAHNGNTGGFVWEQTVATTEYSDGEVIYRCPECGYIERTTGGDAYDFFNDSFIRQVRVGKPGQTITIEAGQWVSFNKALIDALRNNREITTNIIYKSNGVLSTLTIPRGTDFSNVPEDKYTGIDYLAYCLGIVPVPKFG